MKILSIALLATALLRGQAQEPVKIAPGTPAVKGPAEPAQLAPPATPPPPVSPDTVVVEVDGKKITAAEMDKIIAAFPPANQQTLRSRPQLLGQIFLMQRLAEDAQKAGLDKQSPYKEQIYGYELQVLSTAELSNVNNTMPVPQDEQQKYYKENPDKFKEVKVKVISVAYDTNPKPVADGKKSLTEAEAKAKIEDLAKQIQGGADFGKLAREHSDDQTSAAKDGDFGIVKQDSSYPKPIKDAVFALKQGEISAPIKQPTGFYLVRAEEVTVEAFNDSLAKIIQEVKQAKFQEWLKGMQAQYNVKVENPGYFATRAPAQLQQVH
jgi:parvulin-like peptidyl-prolyl isomerase